MRDGEGLGLVLSCGEERDQRNTLTQDSVSDRCECSWRGSLWKYFLSFCPGSLVEWYAVHTRGSVGGEDEVVFRVCAVEVVFRVCAV